MSEPPDPNPSPDVRFVETARLGGEPLTRAHLPFLLQLFQDPRVTPTLTATGKSLPTADVEAMIGTAAAHWQEHGWGSWMFRDKETGAFVGRGGLRNCVIEGRESVEVGYALAPEFWGKGLATEMARQSVRVAFDVLHLPDLVCFTLVTNLASQNVMQKAGFVFDKPITYANLPHLLYRQKNAPSKN